MRQNQSLFPYTSQQLLSLADTEHFARSSRALALPYRWLRLARSGTIVWGEYPQKDKENIRTQVHLPDMQLRCSCASKIFPCHHSLALLMMLEEDAELFRPEPAPLWLEYQMPRATSHTAKTALDDWQKEGLAMLEKWLFDLIYLGLEQARSYPYMFWQEMANRLIDARLGTLADDIKTWGQGTSQDGWSTELLAKMGRLQILLEAFKRFENLPHEVQADLLRVLGIAGKLLPEQVKGRWLVVGRSNPQSSSRKLERIWLKSLETGQFALFENVLLKPERANTQFLTGTYHEASLSFYEASVPLHAVLRELAFVETFRKDKHGLSFAGQSSIKSQFEQYAKARAKNPWLEVFPFHLGGISVDTSGTGWRLKDQDGYQLKMPKRSPGLWHMRAQAFDESLSVFGEYRDKQFFPLAMDTSFGWSDVAVLRGGMQ